MRPQAEGWVRVEKACWAFVHSEHWDAFWACMLSIMCTAMHAEYWQVSWACIHSEPWHACIYSLLSALNSGNNVTRGIGFLLSWLPCKLGLWSNPFLSLNLLSSGYFITATGNESRAPSQLEREPSVQAETLDCVSYLPTSHWASVARISWTVAVSPLCLSPKQPFLWCRNGFQVSQWCSQWTYIPKSH